jgi:O-antigen/teichoic acid export membrane protein
MSLGQAIPTAVECAPVETLEPRPASQLDEFHRQIGHVSRHSSIFFLGSVFTLVAGYIFKVYLARVLGPDALGIYALGMTLVGLAGVFSTLGLPQAALRFVAVYSATGRVQKLRSFLLSGALLLLVLNVGLAALVVFGGPSLVLRLYHAPGLVPYLWMFAVILLLGELNSFLGQVLAAYKNVIRRTVITSFISFPVLAGVTVLLIAMGAGLSGYILAQVVSAFVVLILLAASVWKATPGSGFASWSGSLRFDPEVVSFSATAFWLGILEFVMTQSDKVLLGVYLNVRSVGVYAMAMALVAFIPIGLQSVNQIFSPMIASLHARSEHEMLARMYQTLTKWVLALSIPLAVTVIFFARPLMAIFGKAFEVGWPVLVVGTLAQLVNCAVGSVGYLLLMSGNQKQLVRVQAGSGLVMLTLSLLLVPTLGILGAALAAAATTVMSNLWNLRQVKNIFHFLPYNRSYYALILPALIACLAADLLRVGMMTHGPTWLVVFLSLVLTYAAFIVTTLLTGLEADDRLIAQTAWRRLASILSLRNAHAEVRLS